MGDRANIAIKQNVKTKDNEPVFIFFYTHWNGSALPMILQSALSRGQDRWGDESYLNRIIFSEMIKDELMDNTGYGISLYPPDNSHELLIVDHSNNTVSLVDKTWSFEDFIKLPESEFADY